MTNLPTTGYTADSANNFLLNAGAVVKNLEYTGGSWSFESLGATSGGSKLVLKNNLRQPEIDGVLSTLVGTDMIESSEATLEVNCVEHTVENIKLALFAKSTTTNGVDYPEGYDVITPGAKITKDHYLKNLAYVGTISGSDKPIIIILHNAICTSGLEFEVKDKAEAIYPLAFAGRTNAGENSQASLPVTILYPNAGIMGAMQPLAANGLIDGLNPELGGE
jgi:hypothetical protein